MKNDITYLVGRLHIIGSYTNYAEKSEYVRKSLESKSSVSKRESEWGFFDVHSFVHEMENYCHGYLVKSRPDDSDETVDKTSHQLTNTIISDRVQAKSHFILHTKSGLICYYSVFGAISDNQFRLLFKEVFETTNSNMLVNADISPVSDPVEIISAIKDFDIIKSVTFKLHPSNPRFNDRWKDIDHKLRSIQADSFKGSFYSEDGLKVVKDGHIMGEILMAVDGYGNAKIKGYKGDQKHYASTEQEPLKIRAPKDASIDELILPVVRVFKEIWDRMTKDEDKRTSD